MTVTKIAAYVPVSIELLVDALPITTMHMNDGDRATEYLRYGQSVNLGPADNNPAMLAEDLTHWWDNGWPSFLDYPDDD